MTRLVLIFIIVFLMVMQAHAQPRGHWEGGGGQRHEWGHPDWGRHYSPPDASTAFLGGVLGGFLGGLFAPAPVPEMAQGSPEWMAYCQNKYKSFNPETGTYTGYDGQQHPCQ